MLPVGRVGMRRGLGVQWLRLGHRSVVMVALALGVAACASPTPGAAPASPGQVSQPGQSAPPAAPKHLVAAIRGDPHTLSEAANTAAGGSSSAGVRELEQ